MFEWPVVPICEAQKLDVSPEDLLNGGLYRKCRTYKAGGGYDKFPFIYKRRYPESDVPNLDEQFVVQTQGCPLQCPYCYVTKRGVNGEAKFIPTADLVADFHASGCGVFHLMGGAPALYLEHWEEILHKLNGKPFHSDFLLCEKPYAPEVLSQIALYGRQLHAVSIKGKDPEQYRKNTGIAPDFHLMKSNLYKLVESGIPFYITFTGMTINDVADFKYDWADFEVFKDAFSIDIRDYNALHWEGN